jgi:hypothetical protein
MRRCMVNRQEKFRNLPEPTVSERSAQTHRPSLSASPPPSIMENRIWRIRTQSLSVSAAPPPTILQKCAENVGFLFFGYLNFFSACSHFSNLLMFFCSLQRHNFLILILVLSNEPPDCLVRNLLPETRMANVGGKILHLGE